eukprot:15343825-Ditylum_brightwellii.AAC.1
MIGMCCNNGKDVNDGINILSVTTKLKDIDVTSEGLASKWKIPARKAGDTIKVTTQFGVQQVQHPITRHFKTAMSALMKQWIKGSFFTDKANFKEKNICGDFYVQVFTDDKGFSDFWLMKRKANASDSLSKFINEYGVLEWMVSDGAPGEGHGQETTWKYIERLHHIWHTFTDPQFP